MWSLRLRGLTLRTNQFGNGRINRGDRGLSAEIANRGCGLTLLPNSGGTAHRLTLPTLVPFSLLVLLLTFISLFSICNTLHSSRVDPCPSAVLLVIDSTFQG